MIELVKVAFRAIFSFLLLVLVTSLTSNFVIKPVLSETQKPLFVVIVDSSIYNGIKTSLDQYAIDVEDTGFSVNITETNLLSDKTSSGLREYLKQTRDQNLVGAFLVGDVSEAYFEVGNHTFPTDVYYMDLDGAWFDLDSDGIYDARGGDLSPEIWVGRLRTSTIDGDEVSLVNNYFRKNHLYRTGLLTIPWWRSLIYIDDQGVFYTREAEDPLSYLSTDRTLVADPRMTNTTDYKNRLKDAQGYQWLYVMSHGQFSSHSFYVPRNGTPEFEGTIYSSDYRTIDPRIFFYQFITCSAARYTEENYLAGSAVSTTTWGLAAIGSTDDIYTFSFADFYRALSEGKNLGTAFKLWLSRAIQGHKMHYVSEPRYQILFNAMTLIGDPTLSPIIEMHDVAITNLEVSLENSSGLETLFITVTAENCGEFAERVSVEIFYDSRRVFIVNLVLGIGESANVMFSPVDSSPFIWGMHSKHIIEARASITSGEFHQSDNARITYFEGEVIKNSLPLQIPPLIFAIVFDAMFGLIGLAFLKQFMSERPPILVRLGRLYRFLAKILFGKTL